MSRSRYAHLMCLAVLVSCLATAANAAPLQTGLGWRGPGFSQTTSANDPLLKSFPELRTLPSPVWVREGLRAYYQAAAATVANPLPAARDGEKPPLPRAADIAATTPVVIRTDVVAMATRFSATYSTVFTGDLMIPWEDVSGTGYAATGDFWVNPVIFRDLEKKPRPPLLTEKMQFSVAGKNYSAVRFDYSEAEGSKYYTWILESNTGLLLYNAIWTVLTDRKLAHVSVAEFISSRTVSTPWIGGAVPAWVKPGAKMTYQGSIKTWLPATGQNMPIPAVLNVEFTEVGQNWSSAVVKRVFTSEGADATMTVLSGTGLLAGGFWVPRANLARLNNGDKLDHYDSVVGSRVEVSYVGKPEDGRPLVAIFEWGTKYKRVWVYRTTDGMLVYWLDEKVVDPSTGMVQQAEWQLQED